RAARDGRRAVSPAHGSPPVGVIQPGLHADHVTEKLCVGCDHRAHDDRAVSNGSIAVIAVNAGIAVNVLLCHPEERSDQAALYADGSRGSELMRLKVAFVECFVVIVLLASAAHSQTQPTPVQPASTQVQEGNPVADPKAIVIRGNARFTVLTPQMLRMEWSEAGKFEDHASLVFINRRLPVPKFTTANDGDELVIHTDALTLKYRKNSGQFTPENLNVEFTLNGAPVTWRPGRED